MDPDLVLQLRRADVSDATIAAMGKARFRSVKNFALFGKDEEAVEAGLAILGLKRADGIESFSEIVSVQTAWLAIRTYHQQDEAKRVETKLQGLVAPMKTSEYASARLAYERAHGGMEDQQLPGQSIIDPLEADLEDGGFRAPRLNDLPSKKEVANAAAGRGRPNELGP